MEKTPMLSVNHRRAPLACAVLLACLAFPLAPRLTRADNITTTWDGTSGDWFDPSKWSSGIPLNNADLYRPIINTGSVTLSASTTTSGLTLGPPALLTLASGNTYTIAPSFTGNTFISGMIVLQATAFLNDLDNSTLTNATLSGTGSFTLSANSSWSGLQVTSPQLTIAPAASVLATGAANFSSSTLTNSGTLYLGYWPTTNQTFTAPLTISASANFINTGALLVESSITGSGTLTNSGFIGLGNAANTVSRTISTPILNSGTLSGIFALANVTSSGMISGTATLASLNNSGLFTGMGTVTGTTFNTCTISGQITLSTGSSSGLISADTPAGNSTLKITGSYTLTQGASISSLAGTVNAAGALTILGQVNVDHLTFKNLSGSGTLNIVGPANWATSSTSSVSLIHISPSGSLLMNDAGLVGPLGLTSGTLNNEGIIAPAPGALDGFSMSTGAQIINSGTITVGGNNLSSLGFIGIGGTVKNNGLIVTSSGNSVIAETFLNAGTVIDNGTLTISNFGTVSGTIVAANTSSIVAIQSSINGFVLSNASLTGLGQFNGTISLSGASTVSNSSFRNISNSGTLTSTATLTINNILTVNMSTLINQGTYKSFNPANLALTGGATFINQAPLTVPTLQSLQVTNSSNTLGTFINMDAISIDGNATVSGVAFNNSGTITVSNSGTLTLSGGGTLTGTLTAPPTGTHGISLDSTAGKIVNLNGATLQGVILGEVSLTNASTAQRGLIVSGSGSLTVTSSLQLTSTVARLGATLIVSPTATLAFSSNTFITPVIDAATLINQGVNSQSSFSQSLFKLAHGATFINSGSLTLNTGSGLAASFDADSDARNSFINSGLMSFAFFNGALNINAPFFNVGMLSLLPQPVNANTGPALNISAGGTASGTFQSSSIGYMSFTNAYTLNNASLLGFIKGGPHLTLLNSNIARGLILPILLDGSGTLTGAPIWQGSAIANLGGMIIDSSSTNATYYGPNPIQKTLANLVISTNATASNTKSLDGTMLQTQSNTNVAWGTDVNNFSSSDQLTLKNGAVFINNGSFYSYIAQPSFNSDNHSANAFINTGTFGRSSLTLAGPSASSNTTTFHVPFHDSGAVDIQQGFIDFAAGYFDDNPITDNAAKFHFAPATGLYFSGGTYDFGTSPFDLGPGGLAGTGTVHANFISSGAISPGNSPGTLTISGDLALNPGATLNLEVSYAGSTPAFDTLSVLGNFSAAGALNLTILAGTPDNTPLPILTASNFTGTFDNLPNNSRLLDTASDGTYLATYSPTGLTLSDFQPIPTPEPTTLALVLPTCTILLLRKRKRPPCQPRLTITH